MGAERDRTETVGWRGSEVGGYSHFTNEETEAGSGHTLEPSWNPVSGPQGTLGKGLWESITRESVPSSQMRKLRLRGLT